MIEDGTSDHTATNDNDFCMGFHEALRLSSGGPYLTAKPSEKHGLPIVQSANKLSHFAPPGLFGSRHFTPLALRNLAFAKHGPIR
jgi:hypothetical protein